jgi:hypothetical protein
VAEAEDAIPSLKIQGAISEIQSPSLHRCRYAAAAMPLLLRRASAQAAWPSRQIRMICSYPAGGQTDLLAHAFGEFISKQVGQTVVIENKAGASSSIGAAEVARATSNMVSTSNRSTTGAKHRCGRSWRKARWMGSYAAAQSVLQGDRGVVFAMHSKKVDAIPNVKTLPEQGATAKFFP